MEFKKIKLIALDVDGVLTDGKLYIGSDGTEYKGFDVKDGMGISIARYSGMKVAMITGRKSESVNIRSKELNIDFLFEGISNKIDALNEIITSLQISLQEVLYIGDDINDLPVIELVGISAAPNDAIELVKKSVDYVSECNGGNGAVRDVIEYVLGRQTDFNILVNKYLNEKVNIMQ